MPFNIRSLEDEKKARLGVLECVSHRLIEPFQVLQEKEGKYSAGLFFVCVWGWSLPSKRGSWKKKLKTLISAYQLRIRNPLLRNWFGFQNWPKYWADSGYGLPTLDTIHDFSIWLRIGSNNPPFQCVIVGEYVAQFKFTVLLMPNGPLKITGLPFDEATVKSEHSIQDVEIQVN